MSPTPQTDGASPIWVDAELRLVGGLDSRMVGLLRAIAQTGSINQAAKQAGLSYKGAWQMIERANNLAPKALIATATGGSKGGGTTLTAAGKSLLALFTRLEQQHRDFLRQLNQTLSDDPETLLLLKPLAIKTSATNQLFGKVSGIETGAVNAEVCVDLKGGEKIVAALELSTLISLGLSVGSDVLLLISAPEIQLMLNPNDYGLSARNCLQGKIIRLQQDEVNSSVVVRLSGGDSLIAILTQSSTEALTLKIGTPVSLVFKSNAVVLATNLQSI